MSEVIARALRLITADRNQLVMTTVDVERLIPDDHPARAIWEFVGCLDLRSYEAEIKSREGSAGRPAYDPRLLVSLWILATSMGEGSAHEIARLCEFHPAFRWLTGMKVISYHTLSDFRTNHKENLDELFTQVLGLLSAENLITLERVTQDGTKIKACASGNSFRSEDKIRAHLELAREQVAAMGDPLEAAGNKRDMAKARALRDRMDRLEKAVSELAKIRAAKKSEEDRRDARASETDPEARVMKQGGGGFAPSYNAQLTVDAAKDIIVDAALSQAGTDAEELEGALERVQERTGKKPAQVVADGGYTTHANIMAMDEAKIDFIGSVGDNSAAAAARQERLGIAPGFGQESFRYDDAKDSYVCPADHELRPKGTESRIGVVRYRYVAASKVCAACPHLKDCHPGMKSEGRQIVRTVHLPPIVAFHKRMDSLEAKAIYRTRSKTAEFPNAWIKAKLGLRQFRTRGMANALQELLWASITYNIQQWIRLSWLPRLAMNTG